MGQKPLSNRSQSARPQGGHGRQEKMVVAVVLVVDVAVLVVVLAVMVVGWVWG